MDIRIVDITSWETFERAGVDLSTPYAVTSSPYGETMVASFATEAEAREYARELATMTGTYMTSWGEENVNTSSSIVHYVVADVDAAVSVEGVEVVRTLSAPVIDRGMFAGTYRPLNIDGLLVGEITGIRYGDTVTLTARLVNGYDKLTVTTEGDTFTAALTAMGPRAMHAYSTLYPKARV